MPELAKDTISLLSYLLPGFLAAWVLYGLTSNPKPGQFERTIEALILTFFIHVMLPIAREILIFLGNTIYSLRPWALGCHVAEFMQADSGYCNWRFVGNLYK